MVSQTRTLLCPQYGATNDKILGDHIPESLAMKLAQGLSKPDGMKNDQAFVYAIQGLASGYFFETYLARGFSLAGTRKPRKAIIDSSSTH